jgi:hypothetical protein
MLAIAKAEQEEPTDVRLTDQYEDERSGVGTGLQCVRVEEYECSWRGREVALSLVDDGRGLGYEFFTLLPADQQRTIGDWFLAWKAAS